MDVFRIYLLRLIGASLISGMLCNLTEQTFFQKPIRLVCSIYVTVTLLSPLRSLSIPEIELAGSKLLTDAQTAVEQGENYRTQSLASIIKTEAEAYIQKEAERIGAELNIEIELSDGEPPAPEAAILCGSFDSEIQQAISGVITREFGIPKENQTWIKQEPCESETS